MASNETLQKASDLYKTQVLTLQWLSTQNDRENDMLSESAIFRNTKERGRKKVTNQ